jgi:hypothetical protein
VAQTINKRSSNRAATPRADEGAAHSGAHAASVEIVVEKVLAHLAEEGQLPLDRLYEMVAELFKGLKRWEPRLIVSFVLCCGHFDCALAYAVL